MGNILTLLRDMGKSPAARDLLIKLDSIGATILMLVLRIVVEQLYNVHGVSGESII